MLLFVGGVLPTPIKNLLKGTCVLIVSLWDVSVAWGGLQMTVVFLQLQKNRKCQKEEASRCL